MIDPINVTDFHRTDAQLEELLLFCISVAGKDADVTSRNLERLLEYGRDYCNGTPFEIIRALGDRFELKALIKGFGFGCQKVKSRGLLEAANSKLNLRTCTEDELDEIHGIGMKTARYFTLHSRENAGVACLDTHILRWMSYYTTYKVPKQTPARKKYLELEQVFLGIAKVMKIHPAVLDLKIWNKSRGSDAKSLDQTERSKKKPLLDRRVHRKQSLCIKAKKGRATRRKVPAWQWKRHDRNDL